ncbi:MAG: TrkH family potassium uptake protein [Thermoprotei archaeon]|nr:MAG: TrkH family potassium uptake protein [Thermoprotei archaeon]
MIKAYLGILAILGLLMLVVPLVDTLYDEPISISFLLLGELLLALGLVARSIESKPLTTLEALIVGVGSWISIPLISAIALSYETGTSYIDSAFESISGFTGTGFTVFYPSQLKHSLILWRSLMQWSGELGFVVFAMVFIPYFYDVAKRLYGIERPIKIEASFYRTASRLLIVYVILTSGGILAYYIAGMNIFESINYVMTTIATGGMATYDEGYNVIFNRVPLTIIPVTILMIIGGMNFYDIYNLLTGRIKDLAKSEELRYYLFVITSIPLMTVLAYVFVEGYPLMFSVIAGLFNSISGITTTGFSIGSLSTLSDTTKAIFVIGMYIGGMTFSTAGGIKALRLMILFKKFKNIASSLILPNYAVHKTSVRKSILKETDVTNALFISIIHAFMVFSSALLISAFGYSFIDSLFEATSAASCVGLSVGVIEPSSPAMVKVILMILMISGRLEYIPLLLLVSLMVSRRALYVLKW